MKRMSVARRATIVASSVALTLVLLKTAVGLLTGSIAVLASAVDSLLDFVVSLFNAIAVRTAEKPRDDGHNYGHGKAEGLASMLEGLFILGSALFVIWQAARRLLAPVPLDATDVNLSLVVMLVSMGVSAGLVWYLRRAIKRTRSLILEADALHYRTDVWSNGAVLLGMLVIAATGWQAADPLIAAGIGVYIAKAALPVIRKGLDTLMDAALPESLTNSIRDIARTHSPLVNGVHELKTRHAGGIHFVEFHLVFSEDITLGRAHRISDEIEARIRALEKTRWVINIHLDPVDDSHRDRKREEEG